MPTPISTQRTTAITAYSSQQADGAAANRAMKARYVQPVPATGQGEQVTLSPQALQALAKTGSTNQVNAARDTESAVEDRRENNHEELAATSKSVTQALNAYRSQAGVKA